LPPDPSATAGTSEVKSHADVSSSGVVLMSIPPNQYSKPLALGMIRIGICKRTRSKCEQNK
jgi:hypothetical protein